MPKSTTCLFRDKEISVDEALVIRAKSKRALPRNTFVCVMCGGNVVAFSPSRIFVAHFEHQPRNEICPLSEPRVIR